MLHRQQLSGAPVAREQTDADKADHHQRERRRLGHRLNLDRPQQKRALRGRTNKIAGRHDEAARIDVHRGAQNHLAEQRINRIDEVVQIEHRAGLEQKRMKAECGGIRRQPHDLSGIVDRQCGANIAERAEIDVGAASCWVEQCGAYSSSFGRRLTHDLTPVVDVERSAEPSAQRAEIDIVAGACQVEQRGMNLSGGRLRTAHDLLGVVDVERLAVRPAERAEVSVIASARPIKQCGVIGAGGSFRDADHLDQIVDSGRAAGVSAERAKVSVIALACGVEQRRAIRPGGRSRAARDLSMNVNVGCTAGVSAERAKVSVTSRTRLVEQCRVTGAGGSFRSADDRAAIVDGAWLTAVSAERAEISQAIQWHRLGWPGQQAGQRQDCGDGQHDPTRGEHWSLTA
jgi:hypothetical protein